MKLNRIIFAILASFALIIGVGLAPSNAVSSVAADGGPNSFLMETKPIGGYPNHPNGQLELWWSPEGDNWFAYTRHTSTNTGTWAWLNTAGNPWPTQVTICIDDYIGNCTQPRLWDGGNFPNYAGAVTIGHLAYGRVVHASGCIQFPDYYPNATLFWHCVDIRRQQV